MGSQSNCPGGAVNKRTAMHPDITACCILLVLFTMLATAPGMTVLQPPSLAGTKIRTPYASFFTGPKRGLFHNMSDWNIHPYYYLEVCNSHQIKDIEKDKPYILFSRSRAGGLGCDPAVSADFLFRKHPGALIVSN